jgi:thiol-disulfide isomerase/thioredoxin
MGAGHRQGWFVLVAAAFVAAGCGTGSPPPDRVVLHEESRAHLEVSLPTFTPGATFSLADVAGRPAVVNFFASWCAPCVTEMPAFEEVKVAVGGEVTFVGIDMQDGIEDGRALVERTGITWRVARDPQGELVRAVGGVGMPTTVLLDADGAIVEQRTGVARR